MHSRAKALLLKWHSKVTKLQYTGQPPNVKYNSTYSVDGRRSSWEGYDSKLRGYGILVKAKNSLVFQVHARVAS